MIRNHPIEHEHPSVSPKLRVVALLLATALLCHGDLPKVEVTNIRRVFHNGEHNAFTDLAVFKGAFYLAFRSCPDGHGVSPNASIIILSSTDAKTWKQVHRFSVPKRDTRDPHFLVFKETLFVYSGTWFSGDAPIRDSKKLELNLHLGYGVSSRDGRKWSKPRMLEGTFGHYVWRAAALGGKAYLCGRRKILFKVGPRGEPNEVESLMLESEDGFVWRKRATFQEVSGDETAFLFERDGSVLAIGRRGSKTAQLLRSAPPWEKWQRLDLKRYIGGPLLTRWGGRTVVGGRHNVPDSGPTTSLCWLVGDSLHEFAQLPSGGDNSYPGFLGITPTRALVSWYSSHEKSGDGKTITAIYLADLTAREDLSSFSGKNRKAIAEADRVLVRQRTNGGWAKGTEGHNELKLRLERDEDDTTLDNGTTHREIRILAHACTSTKLARFREGCLAGIDYLFAAQYRNGGWPQRFPQSPGYARYITYNDGAMIGALGVLREVARKEAPFDWVDDATSERAEDAVARGIACILKCQVIVEGARTAWGQQHDEVTLQPRPARTFEPVSLCSAESVGVVRFLMRLESPSPEVVEAIESAVAWLSGPAKLTGIRLVQDEKTVKRIIKDSKAPALWSRLYEIGTNRPIFGDRDGKVYYHLAEISQERRGGYGWYGNSPKALIEKDYPAWQKSRPR